VRLDCGVFNSTQPIGQQPGIGPIDHQFRRGTLRHPGFETGPGSRQWSDQVGHGGLICCGDPSGVARVNSQATEVRDSRKPLLPHDCRTRGRSREYRGLVGEGRDKGEKLSRRSAYQGRHPMPRGSLGRWSELGVWVSITNAPPG